MKLAPVPQPSSSKESFPEGPMNSRRLLKSSCFLLSGDGGAWIVVVIVVRT